ncbi:MAG: sulfurtransferase [Armatimonadota bacterium]
MRSVCLTLILLAAGLAWAGQTLATPDWVAARVEDPAVRIIDVRQDFGGYITAHVPGAVYLYEGILRGPREGMPVQFFPPTELEDLFSRAGVRDGQTVVLYSEGESVLGATMAAYALEKIGYPEVAVMDGGWGAYKAMTLPATQLLPTYKTVQFRVREQKTFVTLDEVKALAGRAVFIDARILVQYSGENSAFMRKGHIPGAVNIDWHLLADPANPHKIKPPAELQALYDAQGIKKTDDIIVYCNTGREASLEYFVLKHVLQYPRVRLYEGSWLEYSAHPEMPIVAGPNPR